MLDQSFSVGNFIKILSLENRKGRNLEKEFFPDVFDITKAITEVNKKLIWKLRSTVKDESAIAKLNEEKNFLKKSKTELVEKKLQEISDKLLDPKFKFSIKEIETDGKPVYTIENTAENYFAMKQLQYNVRKSFKVKQANRFAIVDQVKALAIDNFPKIILRTDVKSFYESIPHDKLLSKINDNTLLSFFSKKLIWKILNDYHEIVETDEKIGLPRGIGVSAYMAELYMRDIDKEIASLENVTYYARYVDDILIVFTPYTTYTVPPYIDKVKKIIEKGTGLTINTKKTSEIELVKSSKYLELNFLGYKFNFENHKFQQIKLTETKINKYQSRVEKTLTDYNEQCKSNPKQARRLLIHRFNFLTGNTRLENNKANVLVGIYYTNSLLTDKLEDLISLDQYLHDRIDTHISDPALRNRLKMFSFKQGFENRKYVSFSTKKKKITLKEILNSW